jgi:hypothetical protein
MLSLHPFLWVIITLVPLVLRIGLWTTSPPKWSWLNHMVLCLGYLAHCRLFLVLSLFYNLDLYYPPGQFPISIISLEVQDPGNL